MAAASIVAVESAELALRLSLQRGTAAYAAYIVDANDVPRTLDAIREELAVLDPGMELSTLQSSSAPHLLDQLPAASRQGVIIDASAFNTTDWALLDRQRSQLAHAELMLFVTTAECFNELMRAAPNLASWLGAQVFASPETTQNTDELRRQRLAALRTWADSSDEEIVDAAARGALPRDPEYAEWLVLLGRSDLIE